MLGTLDSTAAETLLSEQLIGRIGCYANNKVYVIPISYAYYKGYIYCHSLEGLKIQMMRQNAHVCFEVDNLKDVSNWQSVVCWGAFEELTDEKSRHEGIEILLNRVVPFTASALAEITPDWPFVASELNKIPGVIFRIKVEEKSSRFQIKDYEQGGAF